jgi:hypothetical protein
MAVNHDGAMMVDRRFRRFFRSIVAAPECVLCAGAITSEQLMRAIAQRCAIAHLRRLHRKTAAV